MSSNQLKLVLYCAAAFLGSQVVVWLVYGALWWVIHE